MEKEEEKSKRVATGLAAQQGGDHVIDRRHRLSLKRYPQDCPPLAVRWFHAIDVSRHNALYDRPSHLPVMPTNLGKDPKEEAALEACDGARCRPTQAEEMDTFQHK